VSGEVHTALGVYLGSWNLTAGSILYTESRTEETGFRQLVSCNVKLQLHESRAVNSWYEKCEMRISNYKQDAVVGGNLENAVLPFSCQQSQRSCSCNSGFFYVAW